MGRLVALNAIGEDTELIPALRENFNRIEDKFNEVGSPHGILLNLTPITEDNDNFIKIIGENFKRIEDVIIRLNGTGAVHFPSNPGLAPTVYDREDLAIYLNVNLRRVANLLNVV